MLALLLALIASGILGAERFELIVGQRGGILGQASVAVVLAVDAHDLEL